jgi:hypothetical protein
VAPALTQRYTRGTPCDVRNGLPREATLRFECTPVGTEVSAAGGGAGVVTSPTSVALLGIAETPTCIYTIRLGTPLVCEHPEVSPVNLLAVQPPATDILCVLEDEVASMGGGGGGGGAGAGDDGHAAASSSSGSGTQSGAGEVGAPTGDEAGAARGG